MVLVPHDTHLVAHIKTGYGAIGSITVQPSRCDVCQKDGLVLECDAGGKQQPIAVCEPCSQVAFSRYKLQSTVRAANERAMDIEGRE
jgi:hypothetical protein